MLDCPDVPFIHPEELQKASDLLHSLKYTNVEAVIGAKVGETLGAPEQASS